MTNNTDKNKLLSLKLLEELIENQQKVLLRVGESLVPGLTPDDLLQPNDFSIIENHPHFRYEEGVLAGLMTTRMALTALWKESIND